MHSSGQASSGQEFSGQAGPTRTCIATGHSAPKGLLVRFVVGPDGVLAADPGERLPGRGLWLTAERGAVASAVARRLFSRVARMDVTVPADLADRLEAVLVRRMIDAVGLARRTGAVVVGAAKVEAALRAGRAVLRLEALDGAPQGRQKFDRLAPDVPVLDALRAEELARSFDRDRVVHAVVLDRIGAADAKAGLVERLKRDCARLAGFRQEIAGSGLENRADGCIEPRVGQIDEGRATRA